MSSSAKKLDHEFIATKVWFSDDSLHVALDDGREVKVPLEFYPTLNKATQKQRENYELIGLGTAIHWPDVDQDLSVEGIVLGIPARV
jgi:hypothetical protein